MPLAFGLQVAQVLRVRRRLDRQPLHDVEAVAFQTSVLGRIVGQKAHRRDPEVDQDLAPRSRTPGCRRAGRGRGWRRRCRGPAPATCRRAACARAQSRDPRGPAGTRSRRPLLTAIFSRANVELRPAVAAPGPEDVAGEALAVDADEHVLPAGHVAGDEGEVLLAVDRRQVGITGELAVLGRDARRGDALRRASPGAGGNARDRRS